jgi:uncharacterized DUF497 family protein
MAPSMEFEWDDAKSDRCFAERGFDFVAIIPAFADPDRVVEVDLRHDYGEPRLRLYGRVEGRLFVVAFTTRGGVHRIISARKASRREIRRYGTRSTES